MKNIFQWIRQRLKEKSADKGITADILQKIEPHTSPKKLAEDISQHFQSKEERKARLLKTVRGNILKRSEEKLKQQSEELSPIPQLSVTILTNPVGILKIGSTDEMTEEPPKETELLEHTQSIETHHADEKDKD